MTQGGDLDIDFLIIDPNGSPLITEYRRRDGLHGLDVKTSGEFEICLDNSFSHLTGNRVSSFLYISP